MFFKLLHMAGFLLLPYLLSAQNDNLHPPLDTTSLDGWVLNSVEQDAITLSDGVLRIEGRGGWLQSSRMFADLNISIDVRFLSDNADSGIFVRAINDRPFIFDWPGNSYQIQIREMSVNRSDNPIWFGNLYRHRVDEEGETFFNRDLLMDVVREQGEWQQIKIELSGNLLRVFINGTLVTEALNIVNASGYIGLQVESGVVEYRNLEILEQ